MQYVDKRWLIGWIVLQGPFCMEVLKHYKEDAK